MAAYQNNVRGYLTYMARDGCPGCTQFSSRILPSLKQALPADVAFQTVVQPRYDSISTPLKGYEAMCADRPAVEFPMLAWSCQPPETAQSFEYLQASSMGKVSNITNWIDKQLASQCPGNYQPQYEEYNGQPSSLFYTQQQPQQQSSLFYRYGQQDGRQFFDKSSY